MFCLFYLTFVSMNRKDMLIGLSSSSVVSLPFKGEEKPNVEETNPLLDLIFQPNERGCVVGDLSMYMSEKTRPEVRQFIEQQLMSQSSDGKGLNVSDEILNKVRSVINDDDVAKFSRNHGESAEQYALRIGSYFSEEKAKNVAKVKFNREKQRLEKLGFNFDEN